jgi:hypothetical protein
MARLYSNENCCAWFFFSLSQTDSSILNLDEKFHSHHSSR